MNKDEVINSLKRNAFKSHPLNIERDAVSLDFVIDLIEEMDTEQKLNIHSVMQAEGSDVSEGAAVGQRSVDTVAAGGIEKCTCPDDQCLLGDHPTCRWKEYYVRKSSDGQP